MVRSALLISSLVISAMLSGTALAADLPKRKPGFWEITSAMPGMPGGAQSMRQCIDAKTDDLAAKPSADDDMRCEAPQTEISGNRVKSKTVCKGEGLSITSQAEFTGDFSSNYQGSVVTHFDPPMMGMKEMTSQIKARWLGPCPAGIAPGDMVMPNGMKIPKGGMGG